MLRVCTLQNAMVFQIYAVLSQALDSSVSATDPPYYKGVALGGFGTGAFRSLILTPVELVKIRLQLRNNSYTKLHQSDPYKGPISCHKHIQNRRYKGDVPRVNHNLAKGCTFSWFLLLHILSI